MTIFRQITGLILVFLLISSPALQAQEQEEELLPPEQAFALSARMQGDTLIAEYKIAPGYYMYRERFDFQIDSSDAPASFDVALIPNGKIKEDEFFGKMETYRNSVTIKLPLLYEGAAASRLQVKAVSQGCADIGVCYPPLKQALAVDVASTAQIKPTAWVATSQPGDNQGSDVAALQALLAQVSDNLETTQQSQAAANPDDSDPLAALQALGEDIGLDDEDDILHPDEAFILSARLDANNVIQTNILMAEDIYLVSRQAQDRAGEW